MVRQGKEASKDLQERLCLDMGPLDAGGIRSQRKQLNKITNNEVNLKKKNWNI